MLKHILLPLDGSELAEKAIEYAMTVISPGNQITLLMVVDPPEQLSYNLYALEPTAVGAPVSEAAIDYQSVSDEMMRGARAYLDSKSKALQQAGYKVNTLAEYGAPAEVIVETAEKLNVDTIVISTHGRSGLSRWILGSVTSKVISAASCPVYVIPPDRNH
ncbi:MAG: universal stress protein [Anaerolineae bacterium]|nr:universal stress protein [Anaerolineae bacterium]